MTLSVRLNSGSRLVVPRKLADAVFSLIFSPSWGGGVGGLRPGVLGSLPRGGFSSAEDFLHAQLVDNGREIEGTYTLRFLNAQGSRRATAVIFGRNGFKTLELMLHQLISDGFGEDQVLQSRTIDDR